MSSYSQYKNLKDSLNKMALFLNDVSLIDNYPEKVRLLSSLASSQVQVVMFSLDKEYPEFFKEFKSEMQKEYEYFKLVSKKTKIKRGIS